MHFSRAQKLENSIPFEVSAREKGAGHTRSSAIWMRRRSPAIDTFIRFTCGWMNASKP